MAITKDTVDTIFGVTQASQNGWSIGSSNNGYEVFSGALDLAGTFAGQGPWAIGINVAATSNGTLSAVQKWNTNQLQPSDVLQITASALSLVIAAAAISGAVVTMPALLLAGSIAIVAGPGTRDQFNELAGWIGEKISAGLLDGPSADLASVSEGAGVPSLSGGTIVVNQYDLGTGEAVTINYIDATGVSHGEFGKFTGVASSLTDGVRTWEFDDDNNLIRMYINPTVAPVSGFTIDVSASQWQSSFDYTQSQLNDAGFNPLASNGNANTVDFANHALEAAGLGAYVAHDYLNDDSLANDYSNYMFMFHQPEGWAFDQGYTDADGDWFLYQASLLMNELGEAEDYDWIIEDVGYGFTTPIVIDLNGDGVQTTSVIESSTHFDLTGDGILERTGWLSPFDGFLVHDRNRNRKIDGIEEMFGGSQAGAGYAKLKSFDENLDGVVNKLDRDFQALRIWQDENSNGQTDRGELHRLGDFGITELDLNYNTPSLFQNGNVLGETSTAQVNGVAHEMADVYFRHEREPAAELPATGRVHRHEHVDPTRRGSLVLIEAMAQFDLSAFVPPFSERRDHSPFGAPLAMPM